jgi:hypothetical protein
MGLALSIRPTCAHDGPRWCSDDQIHRPDFPIMASRVMFALHTFDIGSTKMPSRRGGYIPLQSTRRVALS